MTLQNRDREGATTAYLITWVCYGTWLPGQEGAVPKSRHLFGAPLPGPDALREQQARTRMAQNPYLLDAGRRQVVLKSLQGVCGYRGWMLLAAHVRSNHVQVVTMANCKPEQIMIAMKAYGSRALNEAAIDAPDRRRWAHHGSTRYLWTGDARRAAINYVVREQGEPMAVFEAQSPR